jgi:uncharacterized protein DUF4229
MTQPSTQPAAARPGLAATIALYALARLALLAAIAAVLVLAGVPVLVAVLVGLIVALPLSMVLFRGLRARLDAAIAVAQQRRSTEREALRARLRGEAPAESLPQVKAGAPGDPADDAGVSDDTAPDRSDPAAPGEPDRGER